MKVGIDIDYCATVLPWFFSWLARKLKEDGAVVIVLTSYVPEIGDKDQNYRYRERQLQKIGFVDYDRLEITERSGEDGAGEDKRDICKRLGVDIVFDDSIEYCKEMSKVTNVCCFVKKERESEQD